MGMLAVATLGLVVNLISMRLLTAGKDSSLNVKGAYLEVWSDLLGSIGVIVAAIVIRFTGWVWVDTVVAVAIGLWVLPRTWILLRDSLNILLEGVPEGVDLDANEAALRATLGVTGVHDLHVWALNSGRASLSAHLVRAGDADPDRIPQSERAMLAQRFELRHVTLQAEIVDCGQDDRIVDAATKSSARAGEHRHYG